VSIGNAVLAIGNASIASAMPVRLDGSFRLDVPFRTQKDGSRFQGANCGPAALAMVLEAHSSVQTNPDLRWLIQGYMGNQGGRGGTSLPEIAAVGRDFGLTPVGIYDGEEFARWTTQDIEEQLRLGSPVIALVKYRLLPDHTNVTIRFDHYIVIYGVQGDRFLYHDPSWDGPEKGAGLWITSAQLANAMSSASIPQHAVAFAPGRLSPLAYRAL
jgi:hypothetical protein